MAGLHADDDEVLQEVLLRSFAERDGRGDDPELQEALHRSCLSAAGLVEAPPEEILETAVQLEALLCSLGVRREDVGSTNFSEGGHVLGNQCFYLAIARSWLGDAAQGGGPLIRDSALQLKREIEASVWDVRGAAALRDLGEEAEAYTDFLACAMHGDGYGAGSAVADLAIVVFASSSGALEAYEGSGYARLPRDHQVANLALVWHRPGHFEAVVAAGKDGLPRQGKPDLTLEELLKYAERDSIPSAVVKA